MFRKTLEVLFLSAHFESESTLGERQKIRTLGSYSGNAGDDAIPEEETKQNAVTIHSTL